MFYLILHTALLILAAFILGAILGCLFKRFFSGGSVYGASSRATPAQSAAAAAGATVAAKMLEPIEAVAASEPTIVEPAPVTPAADMDEAAVAATLAALPADASNEDKANAVGMRPAGISAPMGGKKDNLQRIKGIGKVNEGKLNELGIFHFAQVRDWTAAEARWVGTFLAFAGRIEREDWIGQARVLADGGETDFAKRVDKGEVSTSSNKKK